MQFAFDLAEAESGRADARRTVMVRNCPNKYSQEMMLSILEKSGFRWAQVGGASQSGGMVLGRWQQRIQTALVDCVCPLASPSPFLQRHL